MSKTVAIVGGGSIGSGFALLFSLAGYRINLYDTSRDAHERVRSAMSVALEGLREFGLIEQPAPDVIERVTFCSALKSAVAGAIYVQECAPESADLKRELFATLDQLAPADVILASSTSAVPPSQFAHGLPGAGRCLVAHPGNPPYLLRIVELVRAPFTTQETVNRCAEIMRSIGLEPVVLQREIEGFVFNRLQGALLREAYCLVRDGVAGIEEIDRIVRDGLGLRWSVIGPFETVDLNTRGGIEAHAARMGPAYARMGAERGQNDPWTPELVARVAAERRALLPLDRWEERVAYRDRGVTAVLAARRRLERR